MTKKSAKFVKEYVDTYNSFIMDNISGFYSCPDIFDISDAKSGALFDSMSKHDSVDDIYQSPHADYHAVVEQAIAKIIAQPHHQKVAVCQNTWNKMEYGVYREIAQEKFAGIDFKNTDNTLIRDQIGKIAVMKINFDADKAASSLNKREQVFNAMFDEDSYKKFITLRYK